MARFAGATIASALSRRVEAEADAEAAAMVARAGGDPRGLARLLLRIAEHYRERGLRTGVDGPAWLADHPPVAARAAALARTAPPTRRWPLMSAADWAAVRRGCG